jgi:DNA primase
MRLYLDDGRFYCFGCGARGDVVQWVSDAERANVIEAIRLLDSGAPFSNTWAGAGAASWPRNTEPATQAARANELPDLDRTPSDRVRAALRAAWGYYTGQTFHAQGAEYLAKRGIDVAVLEAHTGRAEVGCTPAMHNGLVTALRARGFTNDDLVDAGVAHRPLDADSVSDYYRQRVLIPLRDPSGELCAIIGRNVGDVRWPKYKNPPRTHAYEKSVNLYQPLPIPGLRDGRVIVVEGTIDAMAIAVAAIRRRMPHYFCPITQSGRELSQCQLESILKLHSGPIFISFDGDAPGRDSNRRIAAAIRRRGRDVRVISLPDGADPASLLARSGPAGLDIWGSCSHISAASAGNTLPTAHVPSL